jgi:Protein of unknown function (DUF2971)
MVPETERPKGLLYHYTTLAGALGILQSGSIRATHVRYLNDLTEIKNAFRPEFTDALLAALFPRVSEETREQLSKRMAPSEGRYDTYLISFTDDGAVPAEDGVRPGDRLNQWRAYSDASGGFCLGFDPDLIMRGWENCRLKDKGAGIYLFRCKYLSDEKLGIARRIGEEKFRNLAQRLAEKVKLFREQHSREPNPPEVDEIKRTSLAPLLGSAFTDYFLEASRFKDDAFAEEHEWRIVFHVVRQSLLAPNDNGENDPIIKFRPGKFGVTPYSEFPLDLTVPESPLRRIVVGPTPHREEAVEAVRLLLLTKGVMVQTKESPEGVEIVPSQIPYRNW